MAIDPLNARLELSSHEGQGFSCRLNGIELNRYMPNEDSLRIEIVNEGLAPQLQATIKVFVDVDLDESVRAIIQPLGPTAENYTEETTND